MTVRIDNDFWSKYEKNEVLLRKCFTYLYNKKYPVSEGEESAYNYLIMEFFRKDIFARFDAERQGKITQTKVLNKSEDKKFQQFVYKWVESVMYGIYHKNRNHCRFLIKVLVNDDTPNPLDPGSNIYDYSEPEPLTKEFLLDRGYCCDNECFNCPY